jgi:DNA-binding beta-propeller fold protein YncE
MPKFLKNFSCSAEPVKALLKNATAIAGASGLGLVAALIAFLAIASAGRVFVAAADVEPTNSRPNPYRTIENWAKLPEGRPWGSTAGVTVDRNGNIWVAERCGANSCAGSNLAPILEFDPSGKLLTSFGAGMFIFPHGITADRDGNIWVTDGDGKDGKGHQVFKFSPKGKVLLALGKTGVAGAGEDTFNKPSAVAIAANGDIFVADGHGGESNARIVKFSKDGKFIMTWGKKGSAPGELNIPHALAFDSKGRLFVADRGNNRIQIFDQNGKFIDQWQQFSRPSGIFIDRNDVIYVADSESGSVAKDHAAWKRGIRIGSAKDGSVASFIPDPNAVPNFTGTSAAEGVAADAKGVIYGAEVGPKDLKKYVRQ